MKEPYLKSREEGPSHRIVMPDEHWKVHHYRASVDEKGDSKRDYAIMGAGGPTTMYHKLTLFRNRCPCEECGNQCHGFKGLYIFKGIRMLLATPFGMMHGDVHFICKPCMDYYYPDYDWSVAKWASSRFP